MDAASAEDLLYLSITFFIAVGLTLVIVVWGREAWKREA